MGNISFQLIFLITAFLTTLYGMINLRHFPQEFPFIIQVTPVFDAAQCVLFQRQGSVLPSKPRSLKQLHLGRFSQPLSQAGLWTPYLQIY